MAVVSRQAFMRLKTLTPWLLLLLVVVLIAGLALHAPQRPTAEPVTAAPALVRVMTVEPRERKDVITLPGQAAAWRTAIVAAEKGGRILDVPVDEGEAVKTGAVMLKLDDRLWRALQRQAAIELADAERDLARWEAMRASGAVPESELDAARRRRELAAVATEQAAIHVDQCTLRAPFDGVVDRRMVEQGEYVNEGQPVIKLMQLHPLQVHVQIPERMVGRVGTGTVVKVRSPSLDRAPFEATVTFVARDASPDAMTYAAELTLPSPPDGLLPGMMVDVDLVRDERSHSIAVPLAAVIPRHGEHVAFVAESGNAVRRVVVLDGIFGQEAIVRSGLNVGDHLVIEGHRSLQDGSPVQVADQVE